LLISYDKYAGTVTISKKAKEFTLRVEAFSEDDQKWIEEKVATLKSDKEAANDPVDPILDLLRHTPEEVATALKNLKMVEDLDSLEISNKSTVQMV
jgi:hypothetical protein